jgi:hypothetical protein
MYQPVDAAVTAGISAGRHRALGSSVNASALITENMRSRT